MALHVAEERRTGVKACIIPTHVRQARGEASFLYDAHRCRAPPRASETALKVSNHIAAAEPADRLYLGCNRLMTPWVACINTSVVIDHKLPLRIPVRPQHVVMQGPQSFRRRRLAIEGVEAVTPHRQRPARPQHPRCFAVEGRYVEPALQTRWYGGHGLADRPNARHKLICNRWHSVCLNGASMQQ